MTCGASQRKPHTSSTETARFYTASAGCTGSQGAWEGQESEGKKQEAWELLRREGMGVATETEMKATDISESAGPAAAADLAPEAQVDEAPWQLAGAGWSSTWMMDAPDQSAWEEKLKSRAQASLQLPRRIAGTPDSGAKSPATSEPGEVMDEPISPSAEKGASQAGVLAEPGSPHTPDTPSNQRTLLGRPGQGPTPDLADAVTCDSNRQYRCHWKGCAYSTAYTSHLTVHMRVHTGEKPYRCAEPGCGYRASDCSTLKRHMLVHTGEKPYRCAWASCNYATARSGDLARHKRMHTGEKPHKCTFSGCNYAASRTCHLTEHYRIHHDGVQQPREEVEPSPEPPQRARGRGRGSATARKSAADGSVRRKRTASAGSQEPAEKKQRKPTQPPSSAPPTVSAPTRAHRPEAAKLKAKRTPKRSAAAPKTRRPAGTLPPTGALTAASARCVSPVENDVHANGVVDWGDVSADVGEEALPFLVMPEIKHEGSAATGQPVTGDTQLLSSSVLLLRETEALCDIAAAIGREEGMDVLSAEGFALSADFNVPELGGFELPGADEEDLPSDGDSMEATDTV